MAETLEHGGRTLSWTGRAVDVERIEAELAKLRYLAAGPSDDVATRTSLANMIVYAGNEATATYASRIIEELSRHHPSRALIVIANPSQEQSHIEASLAAHCHAISSMEQTVCCEEVTLRISGKAALHLHSIIVPLLVPDLPVAVWWTGDFPDDSHLIEQLCAISDHFIIDSIRFEDQTGDLVRVRALADLHNCEVGDLNFERIRPWRDIFERYVESGGLSEWLTAVKGIEIRYADVWGRQTPGQAVLMLAWLAGRLGLDTTTASGLGSHRFSLRRGGSEVEAFLAPVGYEGVDRGWLVTVKVAFEDERGSGVLAISRTADPLAVTILTRLPDSSHEDHVRIEATDSQSLITHQLDAAPHDPEFARVLSGATPLIQAAGS
jgi:glucose-6-phosphate dehydrogenase assembly protein OpcA